MKKKKSTRKPKPTRLIARLLLANVKLAQETVAIQRKKKCFCNFLFFFLNEKKIVFSRMNKFFNIIEKSPIVII